MSKSHFSDTTTGNDVTESSAWRDESSGACERWPMTVSYMDPDSDGYMGVTSSSFSSALVSQPSDTSFSFWIGTHTF